MEQTKNVNLKIEFSGGLELLLQDSKKPKFDIVVDANSSMKEVIKFLRDKYIKERPELFSDASHGTIRPGVLVIINGSDWELENGLKYVVQDNDELVFISTLHGG